MRCVLRRLVDGNYLKKGRKRYARKWTQNVQDAFVFSRICDARNSINMGKHDKNLVMVVPVIIREVELF